MSKLQKDENGRVFFFDGSMVCPQGPPPTVRVTHLPTGLSEECCEHFSQHKNKAAAFERLRERLEKL